MNEQELKNLWRTAETATPAIDFTRVEKLANDWNKRLRRKVKTDITLQIAATIAGIVACIFYPKLILFGLLIIPVCIWYVRELHGLYRTDAATEIFPVSKFLELKIKTFESFFRRTRFVVYVVNLLIIHAFCYSFGFYNGLPNDPDYTSILIKSIIFITFFYESSMLIANELYFKFVYKPAYHELKELRDQLNFAN